MEMSPRIFKPADKNELVFQKFSKLVKSYNECWTNGKSLHEVSEKFEKIRLLDPHNNEIKKCCQLIQFKIRGDENFKKGQTCQRQAATAFTQHNFEFSYSRYTDAIQDLSEALQNYEEGLKEDARFKEIVVLTYNQLEKVLEERDQVKPLMEADEKRKELERPLRKAIQEERMRQQIILEAEKEEKKKQINRQILAAGFTMGGLALLSNGGPSSNLGGHGYFGLTTHTYNDRFGDGSCDFGGDGGGGDCGGGE